MAGYSWDTVATFVIVRYEPDGTLAGVAIQSVGKNVVAGSAARVLDGHMGGRFAMA